MAFLAILVGLNAVFQIYNFQQKRKQKNLAQSATAGATTGIMGVFAGVVGTAACASCLASLFGLVGLGTGSVLFVLQNQSYFLIGAIALMLVSLYFATRKINQVCASC
jgi:disulfide bond formation protein DsbB